LIWGGGAKFLKGGDIQGGDIPRRFAPGGGESPVTPVPYYRENSTLKPWLKIINYRTLGFGNIFPMFLRKKLNKYLVVNIRRMSDFTTTFQYRWLATTIWHF
jgi:hypothetical protein